MLFFIFFGTANISSIERSDDGAITKHIDAILIVNNIDDDKNRTKQEKSQDCIRNIEIQQQLIKDSLEKIKKDLKTKVPVPS